MVGRQLKRQYKFWHKEFSLKGSRAVNEDRLKVIEKDSKLLLLTDGMGGYLNGDIAAELAIEAIEDFLWKSNLPIADRIREACQMANNSIIDKTPGAGATLGGLYIDDEYLNLFWAGDVRIYIKSINTDFTFVTKDHTLAQVMKDSKILVNPAEISRMRNTVTRGLGSNGESGLPEIITFENQSDLIGMICSDGFHTQFQDDRIFAMLREFSSDRFLQSLLETLSLNSNDNASAIVFRLSHNVTSQELALTQLS